MTGLDAIVVNYNTCDALRSCLSALVTDPDIERIFVADNGSADGSLEMVRSEFPLLDVHSFPDNPGYGGAINRLMVMSTAGSVLCLNADVRLRPGCAARLGAHLDENPTVALAGPLIFDADDRVQRSVFREPSLWELTIRETGLERLLEALPWRRTRDNNAGAVDWVLGASMVIRRAPFEEMGGFDDEFVLYFEEVDLCRRLRNAGWTIDFVASAAADHIGGASTSQRKVWSQQTYYRSLHRYHRIHHDTSSRRLALLVRAIMLARLMRDRLRCRRGHDGSCVNVEAWSAVRSEAKTLWSTQPDPTQGPQRRSDWLQLLPEGSDGAVTIGDFDHDELNSIRQRFGRVLDRSTAGGADVVIARVGHAREVGRVAAAVRPGGVAYVECAPRGLRCPPLRIRRALRRSGLMVASSHWLVPDQRQPRCYVPIDHAGALRWYLAEQFVPRRWFETGVRRLLAALPRLGWALPGAHAHVAARSPATRRRPALLDVLEDAALGAQRSDSLLLMTSGQDIGSRSIVLPFPAAASAPSMTVKVSGHRAVDETTLREHHTLIELQSELPTALLATVPTPIGLFQWQRRTVTVESFLGGPTVDTVLREPTLRHLRPRVLDAVTSWVIDLHQATSNTSALPSHGVRDWTEPVFRELLEVAAPSDAVVALIERAQAESRRLDHVTVPSVRRHMDLAPWNLIWTGNGIGAVDWESADNRPAGGRGVPFCDLDYFVKYYLHATCPTDNEASQAALSPYQVGGDDPLHPEAIAAGQALRRYVTAMSLDNRLIPVLVVYNWSEHAVNRCRRNQRLGVAPLDSLPMLQHLDVIASGADRFFDAPLG